MIGMAQNRMIKPLQIYAALVLRISSVCKILLKSKLVVLCAPHRGQFF